MTYGMGETEARTYRRASSSSQGSTASSVDRGSRATTPFHLRISPCRGISSAPHSRSSSVKRKPRPKELELITCRQRTNSMPVCTPIQLSVSFEDIPVSKLQRVRSFSKTSKGLVNRGDSFKRKSTSSVFNSSVNNCASEPVEFNRDRTSSSNSQSSTSQSVDSGNAPSFFRVVMLGAVGVGKTALTQQFMTSEYMGACDTTYEEGYAARTVSVLLDGEESTVDFIDPPGGCAISEDIPVDGYVVVYSKIDRSTYDYAVDILHKLRHEQGSDRPIILVANKIDVVRKQQVSTDEAHAVAKQYGCKCTETSAAINHQVDELLVGLVSQIRLKLSSGLDHPSAHTSLDKKSPNKKYKQVVKGARGLLNRILKRNSPHLKACDNLYVL
ncbi:GTP-binding protein RAD-like isoform X2 [Liolophura sinensis]|uniref:GTP-binding protein RAD-like isoform X2 n=1 Tax=Liolophura sinensis TaxID=3198878 RepID=UPI00315812EF